MSNDVWTWNLKCTHSTADGLGEVAQTGPFNTPVGDCWRPQVTYMDDSSDEEDWSQFMQGQYPSSPQPLTSPQLTILKIQSYSITPTTPPHQPDVSPAWSYSHTPTPAQRPPNSKYTPRCCGKKPSKSVASLHQEARPSWTLNSDYINDNEWGNWEFPFRATLVSIDFDWFCINLYQFDV